MALEAGLPLREDGPYHRVNAQNLELDLGDDKCARTINSTPHRRLNFASQLVHCGDPISIDPHARRQTVTVGILACSGLSSARSGPTAPLCICSVRRNLPIS